MQPATEADARCPECGSRLRLSLCEECCRHRIHSRYEPRCGLCRAERLAALVQALRIAAWRLARRLNAGNAAQRP